MSINTYSVDPFQNYQFILFKAFQTTLNQYQKMVNILEFFNYIIINNHIKNQKIQCVKLKNQIFKLLDH